MALTAQEQQLFDLLNQKAGVQPPAAPQAQPVDMAAIQQIIDAKVAEKVSQLPSQRVTLPTPPVIPQIREPERPMEKLVNPERALFERLRPLVMRAMTFEQKGRFAELALNVRLSSRSKEEAYRVGLDAFCDFLNTNGGREWIQVGAAALLGSISAVSESADVPSNVNVNQSQRD